MNYNEFIGIDVAKDKFDVCFLKEESYIFKTFHRTKAGLKSFLNYIKKYSENPLVCMEATGHYSEEIADFLCEHEIHVSVINPIQIKYFTKVKLSRNKNDIVDAKIIADYCKTMQPRLYQPRSLEQKYIRELIQLEDTLKNQKIQLKNQLR